MELADLALWTPIRLGLQPPDPFIDWCDLRGLCFEEPFFDQTAQRWTTGPEARPVVRTGLHELAALDAGPTLDPCGFIFHMSRCGSTLLSRLLGTLPGMVVAAEPGPINALLEADPDRVDAAVQVTVLRLLIRALGRIRAGDETGYVVKLSSWNVRLLPLFRRAFPATPWIWVQRRPAEVMASILAGPPGWMQLRQHPRRAQYLFGLDPAAVAVMAPAEFCVCGLAAMLEAWLAEADATSLVLDYRDLPAAVWRRAAPFLGLTASDGDIARMAEEARYSAKDEGRRVFPGAERAAAEIPAPIRDLARLWLDPLYCRLSAPWPVDTAGRPRGH